MSNELFIGALDLSPYLKTAHLENANSWELNCWHVPEGMCAKLFCNPIIPVPLFLRWRNYNHSRVADFSGFPNQIVCADFLFLEQAPYTEIHFTFNPQRNRFAFHIRTRLYLATGEGQ